MRQIRLRSIAAAVATALGAAWPIVSDAQLIQTGPAGLVDCSLDRYVCATTAYRAGDLTAARNSVSALLNDRPNDADALLLSGLIASRQGDLVRARTSLDHAASVAPAYADVFVARARLNLREGRLDAARADIGRVAAVSADHPDLAALRAGLAGASTGGETGSQAIWITALDYSVSRLSRASPAWYETQATIARRKGPTSVALEVEHSRRFDTSDVRFQFRADHRIGEGSVYAAALTTVHPDFRETWGLRAGGFLPVSARVDILVDARFSNYGRVNSGSVTTSVRGWSAQRHTAIRLSLVNFINEAGSYQVGLAADISQLLSTRARLQAGYARYPETEGGVTRRIESAFISGAYQVSDTLGLRIGIERETRQRAYRRDSATAGLSVGF
ncbi:YaiO family outer membrane beta-barrel protein [Sphingomonas sp. PB2P12]|uniref:YaiO family outer membrane beta-barrel protein n=1 Tax=Sphingomonas sandaracina TaxID=3096157 RepID=UPI002FC6E74D